MTRRTIIWTLVAFWLFVGFGYVIAALRQKEHLNLSATSAGQMPYLVYAQHVAADGLFGHFGDRNRMPFVPVLLSLVHDKDWQQFASRASHAGIALSLALLAMMGIIAYRELSPLFATAYLLVVAVAVFAPQASFVQADVAYYAFFFCSWWAMSRLVNRPTTPLAVIAGAILGLTYLTKASILLAVPIWLVLMVLRAIFDRRTHIMGSAKSDSSSVPSIPPPYSSVRALGTAAVTLVVFLATIFPYLQNNHQRFGHYFYNVNTTFFVWCDSWSQARRFAETYAIDQHFPDAPPVAIPSPHNYWHTHTFMQISGRMVYGVRTLGRIALESASMKYLLFLVGCAVVVAFLNPAQTKTILRDQKWPIAFSVLLLSAYVLAYAWYVVVAYGDRFVLSLVPPIVFGLCLYLDRMRPALPVSRSFLVRMPVTHHLALLLVFLAIADGVVAANTSWVTPSENYIRFYYDESHEELRRGNLDEAQRGMRGVLALDPGFAAAHRDLGMMALGAGKYDEAIQSLSKAAMLEPNWADVQNSLGSALVQSGRLAEAIPVLERAIALQPDLAPAWYNLCGALLRLNDHDRANTCLIQLARLSPELAQDLKAAFGVSISKPP